MYSRLRPAHAAQRLSKGFPKEKLSFRERQVISFRKLFRIMLSCVGRSLVKDMQQSSMDVHLLNSSLDVYKDIKITRENERERGSVFRDTHTYDGINLSGSRVLARTKRAFWAAVQEPGVANSSVSRYRATSFRSLPTEIHSVRRARAAAHKVVYVHSSLNRATRALMHGALL